MAPPRTASDPLQAVSYEIARRLVESIAPAESEVFILHARASDVGRRRPQSRRPAGSEELLGAGTSDVVVPLLTPVALAVAAEVVRYLAEDVLRPALQAGGNAVAEQIRRRLRGSEERGGAPQTGAREVSGGSMPGTNTPILKLDLHERVEVRRLTVTMAEVRGLDAATVQGMADLLAGPATGPPDADEEADQSGSKDLQ